MTAEEKQAIIRQIESDIQYFTNLGFDQLVQKFKRDLELIKSLDKKD